MRQRQRQSTSSLQRGCTWKVYIYLISRDGLRFKARMLLIGGLGALREKAPILIQEPSQDLDMG